MRTAALIGSVFALIAAAPAMAVTISFADTLVGVDNPNSAPFTWSTDDNVAELNPSYSLLGGTASVSGTQDGSPDNLSARLTRGLGVWDDPTSAIPVEGDEIDNFGGTELVTIDFNQPYVVNSIEVRSLFDSDPTHPNTDYLGRPTPPEEAMIKFYDKGVLVHTEFLTGTQFLGTELGQVDISYAPGSAYTVDQLVFGVPTSADLGLPAQPHDTDPYTFTDYAVAKLDVTPAGVPEPLTMTLGVMGLAALGMSVRRRGMKG